MRKYITILFLTVLVSATQATPLGDLQQQYKSDNETYFADKLPKNTRVIFGRMPDAMAKTTESNGVFTITVDPTWAPAPVTQRLTLLHEECHVETWGEFEEHGRRWKSCMMRLRISGAFDDLL